MFGRTALCSVVLLDAGNAWCRQRGVSDSVGGDHHLRRFPQVEALDRHLRRVPGQFPRRDGLPHSGISFNQ